MPKVFCKRSGCELEGMEESPIKGPLSEIILNNVSQSAWDDWMQASIMMLNEYRLNLLDPKHQEVYDQQMLAFFGLLEEATEAGLIQKPADQAG